MGLFDKFKKGKEDKFDKQIAELQAKNAKSEADADTLKTSQDAEKMMKAFTSDTLSGAPVSAAETMNAAKIFDSLAGSFGLNTNMTKTVAKQTVFETPDIIEVRAGSGSNKSNNFIFGVDNNYAPVYYCVETENAYSPSWAELIDMIIDSDMFNTNGCDSNSAPSVMSTRAGSAKRGDYTMVFGVAENYSPVVYCNELKKYVHFSWDDISRHALDKGIDSQD